MKPLNNYINHIVFVVDKSGSMSHLKNDTIRVFDNQISHLSKRSQELDQETRVSVYLFDDNVECVVYDKDVMRLSSLRDLYEIGGNTALRDGTSIAIKELAQTAQLHGDHSFLMYVLTDGQENRSRLTTTEQLKTQLANLADNWTIAVLVPDALGVAEAKRQGFLINNTMTWNTSVQGLDEVGSKIREATDNYMVARTKGIRGTQSLFTKIDTSALASRTVSDKLDAIPADKYLLADVNNDIDITTFATRQVGRYVKGNVYYQLTKTEEVQPQKQVAVQNKISGNIYTGAQARNLLGLPTVKTKVKPDSGSSRFNIFIQSTSVNRKLVKGTKALILK